MDGSMEADGWERVHVGRRRTVKAARRMKEGKGCRLDGGIVALCGRAGPERQCLRGRPERQRTAQSGKFGPRRVGVRPEEPRKQWETLGKRKK